MKTSKPLLGILSDFLPATFLADKHYLWNALACVLIAAVALLLAGPGSIARNQSFEGISPGKIAERDIVCTKSVVYVDKLATQLRIESEERLVLPVFRQDENVTTQVLNQYKAFGGMFKDLAEKNTAIETMTLMLQSNFPGLLPSDVLTALARSPLKLQILVYAEDVLSSIMQMGVVSIPTEGLEYYNQDYFELAHTLNNKTDYEQRTRDSMVTKDTLAEAVNAQIMQKRLAGSVSTLVAKIVMGFATENTFFDKAESQNRLAKARSKVEPVTRVAGQNEVLVRAGEMVTEETYARIMSIKSAMSRADTSLVLSGIGLLLAASLVGIFLIFGQKEIATNLNRYMGLLIFYSALVFFIIAIFAGKAPGSSGTGSGTLDGAYWMPTALFVGLISIVGGQSLGFSYSIVLALLAGAASNLNAEFIVFTLFSGVFMSLMSSMAKSRLSLAEAAVSQAVIQFGLAVILILKNGSAFGEVAKASGLLALNGFVNGALILAALPVLEQTLNLPTRFRLMELADANSPALKELMTKAPGTYAHSLNVAFLAEAAAQAIGANALLARVGAYYHDIGKVDQPEYFVENQRGQNKHDDINPRLSATVIRSHVKLGAEKARELGLPKAVVEIVAQHHGNSTISWFYDKAKSKDSTASEEDFSYPGSPPTTKEAGIVMLADTVEAALRTLKNPSLPRLDTFIHQLITDKVQQGQLDQCPLTLQDLDNIRQTFVRITAGQFHSRIEYPNQKEPSP